MEFSLNPIALREVRARWRKWPSLLVLCGYAIVLAVVVGWNYHDFVANYARQTAHAAAPSAVLGRNLFAALTWMQAIAWMLLAPLLAAPAIASEREKGLLQGLLLAGMTPRQIVLGKLQSVLWFIGLLLVVPLPIISTCFLLGGVSPQEFLCALCLHTVTAATGCAMGLYCSARQPTTARALLFVSWHVFLWFLVSPCCVVSGFLNPVLAVSLIGNPHMGERIPLFAATFCSIAGQLLLMRTFLARAARSLEGAPEEEPRLVRTAPIYPITTPPVDATTSVAASRQAPPDSARQGEFWHVPLLSKLHFDNPIFEYEFHRRIRLNHSWVAGCAPGLGMLVLYATALTACAVKGDEVRFATGLGWFTTHLWLIALMVAGAFAGALSFSRDRECGVLASILVTPLRPRALIAGKLGPPLLIFAFFSLIPLPVVLGAALGVFPREVAGRLTSAHLGAALIVLTATTIAVTALGMLISWFSRRTVVAVGWTMCVLFVVTIGVHLLHLGSARPGLPSGELSLWLPFSTLHTLIGAANAAAAWKVALAYALRLFTIAAATLLLLHLAIELQSRERDRTCRSSRAGVNHPAPISQ